MEKQKRDEFLALRSQRQTYLQKHLDTCKVLEEEMSSYENKNEAKALHEQICEHFKHVANYTMTCLIVCTNADDKEELRQSFDSCQNRYSEVTQKLIQWIDPDVDVSEVKWDTKLESMNAETLRSDGDVPGARMNLRGETHKESELSEEIELAQEVKVDKKEPGGTISSYLKIFLPREGLVKRRLKNKHPDLLKKNDTEIYELIESEVMSLNDIDVNIAVTGRSGSGKSTLINKLLGLTPDMEGAAAVGVKETTQEPKKYQFPQNKNVKLWDLPGAGTTRFPKEDYVRKFHLEKFQILFIVSCDRFTAVDKMLLEEAEKIKVPAFYIRTKVQNNVDDMAKCYNKTSKIMEKQVLEDIQLDLKTSVGNYPVYLIDSYEDKKYDFPKLLRDLMDCNRDIKDALVQCINVRVGIMIDLKKDWLLKRCWWYGIRTFFRGIKKNTFENQFEEFKNFFHLDDRSIEKDFEKDCVSSLKAEVRNVGTTYLKHERLNEITSKILPHKKISSCDRWAEDCVKDLAKVYSTNLDKVKKV